VLAAAARQTSEHPKNSVRIPRLSILNVTVEDSGLLRKCGMKPGQTK
jgi:hypothetical protein